MPRGVHELAADCAVIRQLALVRGLHGGHGAILRARDGDELLRAALPGVREVKVIADEQQECVVAREFRSARDRVRVAEGCACSMNVSRGACFPAAARNEVSSPGEMTIAICSMPARRTSSMMMASALLVTPSRSTRV